MRLKNKVAVITGAGSGIGRTTAILFAKEGAKVVIVDIDKKAGEETLNLLQGKERAALFIPTDITDVVQVKSMVSKVVERYRKLDILINNAGLYAKGDASNTDEGQWDKIMNVNLRAAFLCSKNCIPQMIKQGGGVVINISSEAGIDAWKNQVAYNVSKAGLISLAKSIAVDFALQNIRANCVCPGTTETELFTSYLDRQPNPESARREFEIIRPANRVGRPVEIAYGILYLASDESPYATGSVLSIDGGATA